MNQTDTRLINRVRMEFLEMPGLALTLEQASRLWNLDRHECRRILHELVNERFLTVAAAGMFLRRNDAA
jgi:hypothetical protein